MEIKVRNVNDAFQVLVRYFHEATTYGKPVGGIHSIFKNVRMAKRPSRNGEVLLIDEPVTITYAKPKERVLFNQARDANPFFHVYESLWMLAGRNDVASLAYYNKRMADYSDDERTFNGAYGWRWRKSKDCTGPIDTVQTEGSSFLSGWGYIDQLKILIDHLKAKPESRRAVLQMWNCEDDLLKIDSSKDVCCNLSVLFSIREVGEVVDTGGQNPDGSWINDYVKHKFLDMTVFNRSNDTIWGALGANYCHFGFLQEYVAANLGVEVGVYNQISNNLHVYVNNFEPEKWLADKTLDYYREAELPRSWFEGSTPMKSVPLVKNPEIFDKEVVEFVERHSKDAFTIHYAEPFLNRVAQPMCVAFHHHKRRQYDYALEAARTIKADDWRIASVNWLVKRKEIWENKNKPGQVTDGKDL